MTPEYGPNFRKVGKSLLNPKGLSNAFGKWVWENCEKQMCQAIYQVFFFHTSVLLLYISYVSVTLIGSLIIDNQSIST